MRAARQSTGLAGDQATGIAPAATGLRASADQLRLVTTVARLYHTHNVRQADIADRLGISQTGVSRLLRQAEELGIVRTVVIAPEGLHLELEEGLVEAYDLQQAFVVEAGDDDVPHILGAAAARHLWPDLQGAVVGITSWSVTLREMARLVETRRDAGTTHVVEMLGDLGSPMLQHEAALATLQFARALAAEAVFLRTPGVVASPVLRTAALADAHVRRAMRLFDAIDVAFVGLGPADFHGPLEEGDNFFSADQLAAVREAGAVGQLHQRFIDATGEACRHPTRRSRRRHLARPAPQGRPPRRGCRRIEQARRPARSSRRRVDRLSRHRCRQRQSSDRRGKFRTFPVRQPQAGHLKDKGMNPDKETLLEMQRRMLRIRRFDERCSKMVKHGLIPGTVHTSIGQEAQVVGACMALGEKDYMTGNHRSHGHPIGKGSPLGPLMAELMGKSGGVCGGKGGSLHLADFKVGSLGESGIVGSSIPIANGAALSAKVLGNGRVSLAFFGDGAANQGCLYESMNLASVWDLPVIFLCENNQYALSTPAHTVTAGVIAERAAGFAMPGVRVEDGQDVLKVYEATRAAVERARAGDGPSLVEIVTYRFNEHSEGLRLGVDYRDADEKAAWRARDPIPLFREHLIETGIADAGELDRIEAEIMEEVEEAVRFAEESPDPHPSVAFADLYATPEGNAA
ncbi:MAG: thiamine pyrophosphate-dependent enzyme [Geminicoccaceae bacterium]